MWGSTSVSLKIWRLSSNVNDKAISDIVSCKAVPSLINVVCFHKLNVTSYVVLATHIQHLLCLARWSCHAAPYRSLACVVYTNKKAKEKNTCFTVPYSITYESTKLRNVNLPNIRGKAGSSIGWSGAHTTANVPFTLSNSSIGPRECLADTVSTIKSRVLLAACHPKNTSSYLFILLSLLFFLENKT